MSDRLDYVDKNTTANIGGKNKRLSQKIRDSLYRERGKCDSIGE